MTPEPFVLSHLLCRAAASDPERQAVVFGDQSISYAALADAAARFAGYLRLRGLEAGDRVAVHAGKSIETVVAIHGAQWAGGVAVPVDPAAPADVVKDLLADAEPFAVVVDRRTHAVSSGSLSSGSLSSGSLSSGSLSSGSLSSGSLSSGSQPDVRIGLVGVDAADVTSWQETMSSEPADVADVMGDDPAYILYTSGSTGRPKGIVHSHRSGLRYAQLAAATYELQASDRLANVAPFHFDQSTFELYAAPAAGATTVMIPEPLLSFPAEVSALVAQQGITIWYSVPTLLVQLLQRGALERHDLGRLRWVLFGGEVFPSESLGELMALLSSARFSNVYGPTEVNHCAHHHLDGPPAAGANIPIGRPWSDTEIRLVDEASNVFEGPGRGTLEVRTATMMMGYWRRPDLTAATIDTSVDERGLRERWYRTGDLVERDESGLLFFLGRVDRQVKVRGHRIELEGVEAALGDAPDVTSCAVVVDHSEVEPSLVGVIEGKSVDESAVLRHLRSALPAAAVPRRLHVVSSLPRTRSGKIDAREVQSMIADQERTP